MSDLLRHLPAVRMARYRRARPEVRIEHTPVDGVAAEEGVWRAFIPLGNGYERVLAGPGEKALMDKLERAEAGG